MQAEPQAIALLDEIAQLDKAYAKLKKEFEALPQRQEILSVRTKLADVAAKREALDTMAKKAAAELTKLTDEDDRLQVKQGLVQKEIDMLSGDYRSVEARTKEQAGYAKRREALAPQIVTARQNAAKINEACAQAGALKQKLDAKEAQLIASFQKEGGALQSKLAAVQKEREGRIAALPDDVRTAYERAGELCGAIAITVLNGESCAVCRSQFDRSRMQSLKADAPLTTCPSCRRLMIVG